MKSFFQSIAKYRKTKTSRQRKVPNFQLDKRGENRHNNVAKCINRLVIYDVAKCHWEGNAVIFLRAVTQPSRMNMHDNHLRKRKNERVRLKIFISALVIAVVVL